MKVCRLILCLPFYIVSLIVHYGIAMNMGACRFWDWAIKEYNKD